MRILRFFSLSLRRQKIYLVFCASQLLASKNVNFFALRCKRARIQNKHILSEIHPPLWSEDIYTAPSVCASAPYTFTLRFALYNNFYSFLVRANLFGML